MSIEEGITPGLSHLKYNLAIPNLAIPEESCISER